MAEVQNTTVKMALDRLAALDEVGFLDAFAGSGFVDDWGTIYRGRQEIDTWSSRELIGAQGVLTVTHVEEGTPAQDPGSGQALVVVTGDWRSSFANGPSRFEFLVVDGLISSMTIRAA
ncbi:nuclear transport factor 2 family protein [Microbacterium sp. 22303]|uniref:nuclear transport factor 2 family protein n=1 Tax=Microbacterium sp. 22303 TaxID=3453905 RepID=UPI003F87BBC9